MQIESSKKLFNLDMQCQQTVCKLKESWKKAGRVINKLEN